MPAALQLLQLPLFMFLLLLLPPVFPGHQVELSLLGHLQEVGEEEGEIGLEGGVVRAWHRNPVELLVDEGVEEGEGSLEPVGLPPVGLVLEEDLELGEEAMEPVAGEGGGGEVGPDGVLQPLSLEGPKAEDDGRPHICGHGAGQVVQHVRTIGKLYVDEVAGGKRLQIQGQGNPFLGGLCPLGGVKEGEEFLEEGLVEDRGGRPCSSW